MRRMESIIDSTDLEWTIMRPLAPANIAPPTHYEIAEDHIAGRQTARHDLAAAITDQLSRNDYLHKKVAVTTSTAHHSVLTDIWREGIKPKLPWSG
jgi:hypothetical protein